MLNLPTTESKGDIATRRMTKDTDAGFADIYTGCPRFFPPNGASMFVQTTTLTHNSQELYQRQFYRLKRTQTSRRKFEGEDEVPSVRSSNVSFARLCRLHSTTARCTGH
ncbi:hypothetical protein ANTRET_LOCUS3526 [Anthophora retusa]